MQDETQARAIASRRLGRYAGPEPSGMAEPEGKPRPWHQLSTQQQHWSPTFESLISTPHISPLLETPQETWQQKLC